MAVDACLRAEQANRERFLAHFKRENADLFSACGACVRRDVESQSCFAKRRPRRNDNQLAGLETGGHVIQFHESAFNAGDAMAAIEKNFKRSKAGSNDLVNIHKTRLRLLFGNVKNLALREVDQGLRVIGAFKAA